VGDDHNEQMIRKQATDLRYIFQAPKLKIGDDERVSIPDLSDADALAYVPSPNPARVRHIDA
jgi:hypothetical protein